MTTRNRIQPGDGDPRHGTMNGYVNLKCRCERCKAARRDEQRVNRQRWAAADPSDKPHGTVGGYTNWRCRCDACKQAKAASERTRRMAS